MSSFKFSEIANKFGITKCETLENIPEKCGYYLLFSENGNLIYIGKAENLSNRIYAHIGPNEENEKIKLFMKYYFYHVTENIEDAEKKEGQIFDEYVNSTGELPIANKKKPPKSNISNEKISDLKVKKVLNKLIDKNNN